MNTWLHAWPGTRWSIVDHDRWSMTRWSIVELLSDGADEHMTACMTRSSSRISNKTLYAQCSLYHNAFQILTAVIQGFSSLVCISVALHSSKALDLICDSDEWLEILSNNLWSRGFMFWYCLSIGFIEIWESTLRKQHAPYVIQISSFQHQQHHTFMITKALKEN